MNEYAKDRIEKLQNNLEAIRKAGGWTAEEFGDMIGTTKQTIRNLENKTTKMTQTQYIAIRTVLDFEAQENPENELLNNLVRYLLDSEDHSSKTEDSAASAVAYVSGAKTTGIDKATMIKTVAAILGVSAGVIIGGKFLGKSTGSWLKKLFPKG